MKKLPNTTNKLVISNSNLLDSKHTLIKSNQYIQPLFVRSGMDISIAFKNYLSCLENNTNNHPDEDTQTPTPSYSEEIRSHDTPPLRQKLWHRIIRQMAKWGFRYIKPFIKPIAFRGRNYLSAHVIGHLNTELQKHTDAHNQQLDVLQKTIFQQHQTITTTLKNQAAEHEQQLRASQEIFLRQQSQTISTILRKQAENHAQQLQAFQKTLLQQQNQTIVTTLKNQAEAHNHQLKALQEIIIAEQKQTNDFILQKENAAIQYEREQAKILALQITKNKWAAIDLLEKKKYPLNCCPLCRYSQQKFLVHEAQCIFNGGKLLRLQCPECDLIFGPAKMLAMTPQLLREDYEILYKHYSEGDSTELVLRTFKHLNPQRDGLYLDYGAGAWSNAIPLLRADGYDIRAYEPYSAPSLTADFIIRNPDELREMRFDGILSNNVIEHFQDPVAALQEMRSLLKPGGIMAHASTCYEYKYEYSRFHLYFFLGRSQQILAKKSNLRIISAEDDTDYAVRIFAPIDE